MVEDPDFSDDVRVQELQSIEAIFSATKVDVGNRLGHLDLPVTCDVEKGVQLEVVTTTNTKLSIYIQHLPPLRFGFILPEKYPFEEPPNITLESKFLSSDQLQHLQNKLLELWHLYKDQIIYSMIDLLQNKLDSELDSMIPNFKLDCGSDEKLYLEFEEYNRWRKTEIFNVNTFSCQICQSNAKGSVCLKFEDCGHVFCNECLSDFFQSLILDGSIDKIHCPDFECTKEFVNDRDQLLRLESPSASNFKFFRKKVLTPPISVQQLARILNSEDLASRYHDLFTKHQYEVIGKLFPKRLTECPRIGCSEQIFRENVSDPLVVCGKCKYAFCVDCQHSWHGKYKNCSKTVVGKYAGIPTEALEQWLEASDDSTIKRKLGYQYGRVLMKKTSDEYLMDRLLDEMIQDESLGLHRCPTCSLIIERLDGCNKMCCSSCRTFFCNLCGIYLDYSDPYEHYRNPSSPCYRKLFEGMPGTD